MSKEFKSFSEFYPFYLSQHENKTCMRLHVFGSIMIVLLVVYVLFSAKWALFLFVPVIGYGFAWVGHFFFEKNKPATFTYPVYSLIGDWIMLKDVLTGRIKI
jgi:hypothetical protein